MTELLVTGKCGSTYGFDGSVKFVGSNTLENLKRQGELTLKKGDLQFSLPLDKVFVHGQNIYIKFRGIDSKEEASRVLTGALVLIPRQNASPLADGEVYCADLVGLDVLCDSQIVGKVASWLEASGSIMLEIQTPDEKKHIIPYQKVFFSQPDLVNGSIEILNSQILL